MVDGDGRKVQREVFKACINLEILCTFFLIFRNIRDVVVYLFVVRVQPIYYVRRVRCEIRGSWKVELSWLIEKTLLGMPT